MGISNQNIFYMVLILEEILLFLKPKTDGNISIRFMPVITVLIRIIQAIPFSRTEELSEQV